MSTEDSPLVYLIYGTPESGRREMIFDLIDGGTSKDDQILYFRPSEDKASTFDEQIEALEKVSVVDWHLEDSKVKHGKISAAPTKIIFLAPGLSDPSDVAEGLKAWTAKNQCTLGRVITLVNCDFLQAQPRAQSWYDACIHFSDVVLLGRRVNVDNRWTKEFESRYRKQYFPCHIELIVKGKPKNPVAVLDPEARRMSLYFDELVPIEEDEFEDQRPEDMKPDTYIERNQSGQRAKPIPSIARIINAPEV